MTATTGRAAGYGGQLALATLPSLLDGVVRGSRKTFAFARVLEDSDTLLSLSARTQLLRARPTVETHERSTRAARWDACSSEGTYESISNSVSQACEHL